MRLFILILSISLLLTADIIAIDRQPGNALLAQSGQRQQPQPGQRRQGADKDQLRDKQGNQPQRKAMENIRRLEQLRVMKLLDLLKLERSQEDRFVNRLREHHRTMFSLMKRQKVKIDELADGLRNNDFSSDEIISRLEQLDELERNKNNTLANFLAELKDTLTPEQLGKLYVFQARFGQEVFEKIRKFNKK